MPPRRTEAPGRTDWAALRDLSDDEIEEISAADADNPATDGTHWAGASRVLSPDVLSSDEPASPSPEGARVCRDGTEP